MTNTVITSLEQFELLMELHPVVAVKRRRYVISDVPNNMLEEQLREFIEKRLGGDGYHSLITKLFLPTLLRDGCVGIDEIKRALKANWSSLELYAVDLNTFLKQLEEAINEGDDFS